MNRAYGFVSHRVKTLTLISTAVLLTGWLMGIATNVSFGQDGLSPKPRVIFSKPGHTVIDEAHRADRVIVKFQEGTRIRERSGQLVALVDALSGADEKRL